MWVSMENFIESFEVLKSEQCLNEENGDNLNERKGNFGTVRWNFHTNLM